LLLFSGGQYYKQNSSPFAIKPFTAVNNSAQL
jgi:hypothetical protein